MESKDRSVRQAAYEAMYSTYEQFQHTYAKTLQTNVKVQNYKARVHKYDSARQAAMAANFIPEAVYDTLLETVNKHLPLLHRYLKLRQEVLGLDDLKMYDVYTPLSETDLAIGYDEALEKAEKVLAVLVKITQIVCIVLLPNVGLMFMSIKGSALGLIQVVPMIPMPLFC